LGGWTAKGRRFEDFKHNKAKKGGLDRPFRLQKNFKPAGRRNGDPYGATRHGDF
jgi:hypothetical protein